VSKRLTDMVCMCVSACVRVMCPHFRSRSRCVYVRMYVCVDNNTGNMMLKEHKLHHCQNDLIFKTQNFAVCLILWLCLLFFLYLGSTSRSRSRSISTGTPTSFSVLQDAELCGNIDTRTNILYYTVAHCNTPQHTFQDAELCGELDTLSNTL